MQPSAIENIGYQNSKVQKSFFIRKKTHTTHTFLTNLYSKCKKGTSKLDSTGKVPGVDSGKWLKWAWVSWP